MNRYVKYIHIEYIKITIKYIKNYDLFNSQKTWEHHDH